MASPSSELTSVLTILDATNHRNKNQHRLSKWWKAFSILHRQTSKLLSELQALSSNEEKFGEGRKKTLESREVMESRVGFLVVRVVPRCYLAFSALTADNQYAALGLMLMGTLARMQRVIGSLRKKEEPGEDLIGEGGGESLVGNNELDLGEVVKRVDTEGEIAGEPSAPEEQGVDGSRVKKAKKRGGMVKDTHQEDKETSSTPSKRPKKKRKKRDAFDELFDRLD